MNISSLNSLYLSNIKKNNSKNIKSDDSKNEKSISVSEKTTFSSLSSEMQLVRKHINDSKADDSRLHEVLKLKKEIANGEYSIEDKLDKLAENLLTNKII